MITIVIPCPHKSGQVADSTQVAADYHPLNRDEIKELLDLAAQSSDGGYLSQIQVRLNQGIVGMECPRPTDGKVARSMAKMDSLFVKRFGEGGHTELVDNFDKLLNWQ